MTSIKYYLLEKIHPSDWNFQSQRAKQHTSNSFEFNRRLKEVSFKISDTFYKYQNMHGGKAPNAEELKRHLNEVFGRQNELGRDSKMSKKASCFCSINVGIEIVKFVPHYVPLRNNKVM